ncbi:Retrotransposable element Tf2 protein type 1-like protein, partial [Dinothrombium tinctorium]
MAEPIKIQKFDGTDVSPNIEIWFNLFEVAVAELSGDRAKVTALMQFLSGKALEYFGLNIAPRISDITLAKAREIIVDRFGITAASPLITAQRMRHNRGTPIKDYFDEKLALLQKTPLDEKERVAQLTEGVGLEFRTALHSADCETAEKWLRVATKIESDLNLRRKPQHSESTAANCTIHHCRDSMQPQQPKSKSKPRTACKFCLALGQQIFHWHNECPNRNRHYQRPSPNRDRRQENRSPQPQQLPQNSSTVVSHNANAASHNLAFEKFIKIPVMVERSLTVAIIDTASTANIISFDLARMARLRIERKFIGIHTTGGGYTEAVGTTSFMLKIENMKRRVKALVLKKSDYSLLLGVEIGRSFPLMVDMRSRQASLAQQPHQQQPQAQPRRFTRVNLRGQEAPEATHACHLSIATEVNKLLDEFSDVFDKKNEPPGCYDKELFRINLKTDKPIAKRPYRHPPQKRAEINHPKKLSRNRRDHQEVPRRFTAPGANTTLKHIRMHWIWPKMTKQIRQYVRTCHTCQMIKPANTAPYGHLQPISTPNMPMQLLAIDTIVMGSAASGTRAKYIILAIDHHSRYVWAVASSKNTTEVACKLLDGIFTNYGTPKALISDNGTNFTSSQFGSFLKRHNVKHHFTSAYHPQANGLNEKANGTIVAKLKIAQSHSVKKWSSLLDEVVNCYNNTKHTVTGFSPSLLLHGKDRDQKASASELIAIRNHAKQRSDNFKLRKKLEFDKRRKALIISPGSLVKRRIPENHPSKTKLSATYDGPFEIIAQTSPVNFRIRKQDSGPELNVHASQIEP